MWWLTPVILAAREVEIGESWFEVSPGKRTGWACCFTPVIPAMLEASAGGSWSEAPWQ
jgi:hypothetical protein